MQHNFLKVAAANINVKLLNVEENKKSVINYLEFAYKNNIDVINFPELTLTGLSAGELIASREIINRCKKALDEIIQFTENKKILIGLGLPILVSGNVYNAHAIIYKGKLVSMLVKNSLDYIESKYFSSLASLATKYPDSDVYLTNKSLFIEEEYSSKIAFIFESDLINNINYQSYANQDVNLIFVIGSSAEDASACDFLPTYLKSISLKDKLGLVYTGASSNESSTNNVYSGKKYIIEAGQNLKSSSPYVDGLIYSDINLYEVSKLNHISKNLDDQLDDIFEFNIEFNKSDEDLYRRLSPHPMIPQDKRKLASKLKAILNIQTQALIRRLNQLPSKNIILGLSGGLDSTLALIVSCIAYSKMNLNPEGIYAITMPGLGTSNRTKTNAMKLAEAYGVTLMEIPISDSVLQHFKDIDHDPKDTSLVFENAQARERTQVLMDMSNKVGGLVLGTGNMSEVALGWSTYNADHMSMYNVNGGITKTLLREVVRFVMEQTNNEEIKSTLSDIINTPISPELLPTNEQGHIAQKTEDSVGPYELHDFFIYHIVRNRSAFNDTIFMAKNAFKGKYSDEEINKWFTKFLSRFSTQQFKRSCMPDGPAIEDFSLNPRNGLIMASDIDVLKLED